MIDISKAKIIKRGRCIYDNISEYEVVIIENGIFYGTGDYEDEPELANDREITCYYGWMDSPDNRGIFNNGRGGFMTVEDAVRDIESHVSVDWID